MKHPLIDIPFKVYINPYADLLIPTFSHAFVAAAAAAAVATGSTAVSV